ncbi:nuclear transport factor 2 family protein [bacterium]|nr:MAG: nuclear transport factor 2 family protein [bacterium]
MKNPNEIAEAYLAAWNEKNEQQRLAVIEKQWAASGTYLDPMMQGEGHQGLTTTIGTAQAQFPADLKFQQVGEAQAVGNYVRFSWHLSASGITDESNAIAGGTDFCQLDENGSLQA